MANESSAGPEPTGATSPPETKRAFWKRILWIVAIALGIFGGDKLQPVSRLLNTVVPAGVDELIPLPTATSTPTATPVQTGMLNGPEWEQLPGETVTLLAGGGNWHTYTYRNRATGKLVTRKEWIEEPWMRPQPVRDPDIVTELDQLAKSVEAPAPIKVATSAWNAAAYVTPSGDRFIVKY